MRKATLLVTIFFAFLSAFVNPAQSRASHAAGGEIFYEWVSDSTYKFYFKFYRDCNGITAPTTVTLCYYNMCNSQNGTLTLSQLTGTMPGGGTNGQPVSAGCATSPSTTCNGGSLPGYQEWWYSGNVTLPSRCDYWRFFTTISSRNTSVSNLSMTGSGCGFNFFVDATLNNLAAQGNSSPYFTVKPVPYVCVNQPYTYNNGAVDPNGDSLAFEFVMPRSRTSTVCSFPPNDCPLTFSNTNYNLATNPFSTNNTFSFNTATGSMSFTPDAQQYGAVAVKVKEYRNGVLIGTIVRDIQIVVVNCAVQQPAVAPDLSTFTGATMVNGVITGCAGQQLSFCYDLISPDTAALLQATDNHTAAAPGSSVSYTGQGTDSIRGCLTWTPSVLDTGLRVYTVTVTDCTPPNVPISQTFTIPIYINPITEILKDTTICPGESANLTAVGGSTFIWSVLPGGAPLTTLSCTNCKSPVATPTVTTQYVVTSNLSSICNKSKDTVTVTVPAVAQFNAGPDTAICINDSLQLNINLVQVPGSSYAIKWTPSTGLSNDTIAAPKTSPADDVTYYIEVVPNGLNRCATRDTLKVSVLKGYTIFNHDTAICNGAAVQINAAGDSRYTYSWTPTTGVSSPSLLSPLLTPTSPTTYVLKATYPGCSDSVHSIAIDVQPVPTVYTAPDQTLCYGDTVQIKPIVTPAYSNYTYTWSPGGLLSSANTANTIYNALNSETLTLTVRTPIGCTGSDVVDYKVIPADFISVSDDTAMCPRDSAQLRVVGTAVSLVWKPKHWISDTASYTPTVWPVVPTYYTVYARDANHCIDTQRVFVDIKPEAVIYLADSARIYPGDSYQLDPSGNALYYQWFPPLGLTAANIANPVATPTVNTRYFVEGTTEFGCSTVDSIDVFVSPESFINVPNAFTPGSAPNAYLNVVHNGTVNLKSFAVYNRWGVKVFETKSVTESWDGTYKGQPQPMGVYIYMVEAVLPSGRTFSKQGNVTLIR